MSIPDKMCSELAIQIALEGEGLTREETNDIIAGIETYKATTFAVDDKGKPTERIVDWDQYYEIPDKRQLKVVEQRLMDSRIQFEEIGIWSHKGKCLIFTYPGVG